MIESLAGLRILLLEDEFLIALDVEQLCREAGASDVVVAPTVAQAQSVLATSSFDVAVVDLLLGSESTLDVAKQLAERGIPFVFASGYIDGEEVKQAFPTVETLGKPYSGHDLVSALCRARQYQSLT